MFGLPRCLVPALCATFAFAAAARADGPLDQYLPKSGVISGNVIDFAVAPEDQAISRQFRHSVQDNMDWFKKAVQSNTPGKPLPYDKHMGITEAQYQQLLHMKPDAHKGAAIKLTVERSPDGKISFKSDGTAGAAFDKISFPPGEKVAQTPFGDLSIFNQIHADDVNTPIGKWNGVEWAQVHPAYTDQPSAKVAFGKRADGQGIMYYQVAPYKGDHQEQSFVAYYDLN